MLFDLFFLTFSGLRFVSPARPADLAVATQVATVRPRPDKRSRRGAQGSSRLDVNASESHPAVVVAGEVATRLNLQNRVCLLRLHHIYIAMLSHSLLIVNSIQFGSVFPCCIQCFDVY